jgi:alpha-D-xyloside xylohydrolase
MKTRWTRDYEEFELANGLKARVTRTHSESKDEIVIAVPYLAAYGAGEKFDGLNLKGKHVVNEVIEKFCSQGGLTYLSIPYFITDSGIGVFCRNR